MASSGALALCLDARVLSEYAEVLARPRFAFDQDMVGSLLEYITHVGQTVAAAPLSAALPDPDDQPFLELALSGGAEYLITGNRRHYPKALCGGVPVVTPAQFVAAYRANLPQ